MERGKEGGLVFRLQKGHCCDTAKPQDPRSPRVIFFFFLKASIPRGTRSNAKVEYGDARTFRQALNLVGEDLRFISTTTKTKIYFCQD